MIVFRKISRTDELAQIPAKAMPAFDPALIEKHSPDEHWVAIEHGSLVARCSLWWRQTPHLPNETLGIIGHYAARDADAGSQLLMRACENLRERGCTTAIGPMDGNTWRRYRLLTERGTEPAFFLEPDNPRDWPSHFSNAQFSELACYTSALASDLEKTDPRIEGAAARLRDNGVEIRRISLANFDAELKAIYAVSTVAFQSNFLYTPIGENEFTGQYQPLRKWVRPELVLLAFHETHPVGFVFAIPDLLQSHRGEHVNTVILKTVAALPGRAYAGLGNLLVAKVHEISRQLGFTRVIHALMHESNNSKNLSGHYATRTIRRYTLFSRRLR